MRWSIKCFVLREGGNERWSKECCVLREDNKYVVGDMLFFAEIVEKMRCGR